MRIRTFSLMCGAFLLGVSAAFAQKDLQLGPLSWRQLLFLPRELKRIGEPDCDKFYSLSPKQMKARPDLSTAQKRLEAALELGQCATKLAGDVKRTVAQTPQPSSMSPLAQQLIERAGADVDALKAEVNVKPPNTARITMLQSALKRDVQRLTEELKAQARGVVDLARDAIVSSVDESTTNAKAFDVIKSSLASFNGPQPKVTEPKIHDSLLSLYLAFRNLRNWFLTMSDAFKQSGGDGERETYAALNSSFNALETSLNTEMNAHDVAPSFAAELITGANVFMSSGSLQSNPTPRTLQAAKSGGTVAPLAYLSWSSRHFGSERGTPSEFSLSGKFGEIPALVVLTPKPPLPATSACKDLQNPKGLCLSDMSVAFETALVASLSARWHFPLWETGELAVRATAGESYLTSDSFVVGEGPGSLAALPVANGTGKAEPYFETGVDISIYGDKLDIIHATKDFLSPRFYVEAGFRNDRRFDRSGDLTHVIPDPKDPTVTSTFSNPARRYFYRFALGNISIVQKDDSGPHTFTLSFGVEGDGPSPGSGSPTIPPTVRLFIKGDVNLLKAFTPGK